MPRAALFDAGDTLLHWNVHKRERFVWLCQNAGLELPDDDDICHKLSKKILYNRYELVESNKRTMRRVGFLL